MPTYDYECPQCQHVMEVFHGMTEKPRVKCPQCGRRGMKKQLGTGAGIIFKGGGFYETDYRSESYKAAQKAETSAGSSDSKSDASSNGSSKDSGSKAKSSSKSTASPD